MDTTEETIMGPRPTAEKVQELRDDIVNSLQEMLADKLEEVKIIQEQLARLSPDHVHDFSMTDPYGDKGKYTGQIRNNKCHGKGTMKYDDGREYSGEYRRWEWGMRYKAVIRNIISCTTIERRPKK